nr:PTS glucose/sucrose transporter subunit IIB [Clostridioides difficile]
MSTKYCDLSKEIIEGVGGLENISYVTHCATRLRFKLKNIGKANTEKLKKNKWCNNSSRKWRSVSSSHRKSCF